MGLPKNFLSLLGPGASPLITTLVPMLAQTAAGEGGGGFLNQNTILAPPLFDNENNPIAVNDADTTTLIENVQITNVENVDASSAQYTIDSLNRIGNNPALVEQAKATYRARSRYLNGAEASAGFQAQDEVQQRAMAKLSGSRIPTEGLTDDGKKDVNKKQRKPTDRHYCSREIHEYNYMIKPLKRDPTTTPYEIVAEAGDHVANPGNPITFGLFVDAKDFRLGVELWRRLWSVAHAKNSKRLTALLGTTNDGLLDILISDPTIKPQLVAACTGVPFLQPD